MAQSIKAAVFGEPGRIEPRAKPHASAARLLALIAAANGRVDARELDEIESRGAFELLGITRAEFRELAESAVEDFGRDLLETSHVRLSHRSMLFSLLHEVHRSEHRNVVLEWIEALMHADGAVCAFEREVHEAISSGWSRLMPPAGARLAEIA